MGFRDCPRRSIDANLLGDSHGKRWRMGNGTKYLIGGAPTVGKSTVAAALAAHLDLPWISTDQIRDILQSDAWIRAQALAHGFSVVALSRDDRALERILDALELA
jgi:2-phosphoglycerate kinase